MTPMVAGGDPGPDRVIFDGLSGAFAGVLTHRDETQNRLHAAVPLNYNPFPPVQPASANVRLPVWMLPLGRGGSVGEL
jgi:hypothetical protein